MLQAGGIGELPDPGRVAAGDARCRGGGHGAGRAGGDHAGLRAGQFGEAPAHGVLQLDDIDEVQGGGLFGGANFGQLQRAAQIRPRTAAIDERAHADARIDVAVGCFGHGAKRFFGGIPRGEIGQQRRGASQFQQIAAVE